MRSIRSTARLTGVAEGGPTAASLFAIVWDALADVLGTAAAAAIVRRATARASDGSQELVDLVIVREDHEYRYTLPPAWSQTDRGEATLRALVAEIGRLLLELTGTVVICRLEETDELREYELAWRPREPN